MFLPLRCMVLSVPSPLHSQCLVQYLYLRSGKFSKPTLVQTQTGTTMKVKWGYQLESKRGYMEVWERGKWKAKCGHYNSKLFKTLIQAVWRYTPKRLPIHIGAHQGLPTSFLSSCPFPARKITGQLGGAAWVFSPSALFGLVTLLWLGFQQEIHLFTQIVHCPYL